MIRQTYIGCSAALACFLAACAVGPNFKKPEAPRTGGVTPPREIPAQLEASAAPGPAQHCVEGLDIPGQWWTLFQSPPLNTLIERALSNSPTLEAAQAALRQANETVAAERGSYYPSVSGQVQSQRQKASGAAFGSIPGFPSSYFYNLQTAQVNVSYTLDAFGGIRRQVEALQAQAEYQQFELEASYLTLTANIVTAAINEASLRAQIAATVDIVRLQQKQLDITLLRVTARGASRSDVLQ